jgi:hypothetical protein
MRNLLPGWVENVAKENGRKQNSTPKVAFSSTVSRDIPTEHGFSITKVPFGSTVSRDIPTECGFGITKVAFSSTVSRDIPTKRGFGITKVAFSSTVSRDIPTKRGFGMTKVAFSSTVCGDIPTEWRSVVLFHAKERYRSIAGESEEDPAVSGLDRRYILSHFQCVSFHGR